MSDRAAEGRLTSSAFERIQRTEAQNNGDEDKHNENFRENGQTMQLYENPPQPLTPSLETIRFRRQMVMMTNTTLCKNNCSKKLLSCMKIPLISHSSFGDHLF